MLLPLEQLRRAFDTFPPLRMRLLEELAREVSRSYTACMTIHTGTMRHGHKRSSLPEDLGKGGYQSHM